VAMVLAYTDKLSIKFYRKMKKTKKSKKTIPKWQPDPRQAHFLSLFLDPKSETFGNAYQSAIEAKYSKTYAEVIKKRMPKEMSEIVGDAAMLKKAESNINEFLAMDTMNTGHTQKGDIFEFDDPRLKKIKADISMFTLERLHKTKWSARQELTGKGGEIIKVKHEFIFGSDKNKE
jgi:hypothetical protein